MRWAATEAVVRYHGGAANRPACQRIAARPSEPSPRSRMGRLEGEFVRDFVAAWDKVMNLDRFRARLIECPGPVTGSRLRPKR